MRPRFAPDASVTRPFICTVAAVNGTYFSFAGGTIGDLQADSQVARTADGPLLGHVSVWIWRALLAIGGERLGSRLQLR